MDEQGAPNGTQTGSVEEVEAGADDASEA